MMPRQLRVDLIWQARIRYWRASISVYRSTLRYHWLYFKHYGWRRIAICLLEVPDHISAARKACIGSMRRTDDKKPSKWE